jgi:hypothetical protein
VETCLLQTISTVYAPSWWMGPWHLCQAKRRHLHPVNSFFIPLTFTPGLLFSHTMPFFRAFFTFSRRLILLLLLISGLHPNPGPTNPQCSVFNFRQFNINGIRSSCAELASFLVLHNIKVACIQESKLSNRVKSPSFPGYAVIRRDRPVDGAGV